MEPLGTKSKYWCQDEDGNDFLFKSIETYNKAGELISRGGEDWAEKISCELAKSLSIPCADYELAFDSRSRGVITRNFLTDDNTYLISGNEILKNYSAKASVSATAGEKQDIFQVFQVMRRFIINKPVGFNSLTGVKSAADFFTGYLMLLFQIKIGIVKIGD
ncbi:hypothetical protein [Ferrimonas pelagia]